MGDESVADPSASPSLPYRLARTAFRALPTGRRDRLRPVVSRLAATASSGVFTVDRLVETLSARDPRRAARAATIVRALGERVPFEAWERHGWHLTRNDHYSPIPDCRKLPDALWSRESDLPGVDMRDDAQVALLARLRERWGDELDAIPVTPPAGGGYYLTNGAFESVDAEICYGLLREHGPRLVVEVGSGWSTMLSDSALAANERDGRPGRIVAVEPYPEKVFRSYAGTSARIDLREAPLQDFPVDLVADLGPGDVFFIDSSHVCRIGSDVQYEFLELLPRLAPGVLVHVHDIFFPREYRRDWVLGPERRFWNEQYLLQAFLAFNSAFEVLWGSAWMHARHPDLLADAIRSYRPGMASPGSFWLRRTG